MQTIYRGHHCCILPRADRPPNYPCPPPPKRGFKNVYHEIGGKSEESISNRLLLSLILKQYVNELVFHGFGQYLRALSSFVTYIVRTCLSTEIETFLNEAYSVDLTLYQTFHCRLISILYKISIRKSGVKMRTCWVRVLPFHRLLISIKPCFICHLQEFLNNKGLECQLTV